MLKIPTVFRTTTYLHYLNYEPISTVKTLSCPNNTYTPK